MSGIDPRLIALFCILFIALGIYNIINGRRRLRQAQGQGQNIVWYKQVGILTGIEYILLACAFLLNISITYGWLPKSLNSVILPVYLVVLVASAILAGIVIYQGITGSRSRRNATPQATQKVQKSSASTKTVSAPREDLTAEERVELTQKRRARRQKAAAARRRHAGKA
jgi:O-antigen/teichoic acid export membrane protein